MPDVTMMDLAHHIFAIVHTKGKYINNFRLQKMLYFVYIYALKQPEFYNQVLIDMRASNKMSDNNFYVWRYGPVCKYVYQEYSIFSANPIPESGHISRFFNDDCLNNYILELLNVGISDLVKQSRQTNYWNKNAKYIRGYRSNIAYPFKILQKLPNFNFHIQPSDKKITNDYHNQDKNVNTSNSRNNDLTRAYLLLTEVLDNRNLVDYKDLGKIALARKLIEKAKN